MAIRTYEKHPLAVLDYGYSLARWLAPTETVNTVNAVKVSGTVALGATVTDGQNIGVMISGGQHGDTAVIDISGQTNANPARTFARRFNVFVTNNAGEKPAQV